MSGEKTLNQPRVLHITPHLGGGVGRCISDLVVYEHIFHHGIVLLERPKNTTFLEKVKSDSDAEIYITPGEDELQRLLSAADAVIIHWWHNPRTCKFLYDFPEGLKTRVILWSHVSGCNYPYLSPPFITCFDRIFITSPCSLNNPFWNRTERELAESKTRLVYGLGKMDDVVRKKDYALTEDYCKIAYVGTLTRSKTHPDFVHMCARVLQRIPSAKFYLFGDADAGAWIREEAEACGILRHFVFAGFVPEIPAKLVEMDIFGYPLNPLNFATTENSLLEAMSVGLPVVCMNQGTEKYIIENNVDGLLADSEEEYIEDIVRLTEDKEERQHLGSTAAGTVKKKFDFESNVRNFENYVDEVLRQPARTYNFKQVLGNNPYEWFFSAVNRKDRELFEQRKYAELPNIFQESSKGSVRQFCEIFPENKALRELQTDMLWK